MSGSRDRGSVAARLLQLGRRPIPVTRRQVLALLGGAAVLGGGTAFLRTFRAKQLRDSINLRLWLPTSFDHEAELVRASVAADRIRDLFPRKGAPRPNEWLALFDEPGQTFNEYLRHLTPATREPRGSILVLPFGEFDERLIQILARTVELIGLFYGRQVRLLPIEPPPQLPADQRRGKGAAEQLFTTPLLEMLKARVPDDAAALIAMTPIDLTPGAGWNFVFGIASLVDRVGVWSLYRLADARLPQLLQLRRVAGVALHELGHMFGIWHCTAYECCMNGSNTLQESDATPLAFCPECDPKVLWRFRLDPAARYARLAEYAMTHDLRRDAALWAECAQALQRLR